MKITVDRKELNENNNYSIAISRDDNQEVIAFDDDIVIELLYEIISEDN